MGSYVPPIVSNAGQSPTGLRTGGVVMMTEDAGNPRDDIVACDPANQPRPEYGFGGPGMQPQPGLVGSMLRPGAAH